MGRIRLLATSDVHGAVFPHFYGDNSPRAWGFGCLNALISSLRDDNTILIDNGDTLEGTPLSFAHYAKTPEDISPASKVMKAMGYDFINLGNHDFNYGESALFRHIQHTGAVCAAANVFYKGERIGPPYTLIEKGGVRIALFGITTQYIPHWEKAENIRNFSFKDAYETACEITERIHNETDAQYTVCIYHGGFERDPETGEALCADTGENEGYRILSEISGIDVLIAGHQHRSFCGKAFGTVYTETSPKGVEIACIDIEDGRITARLIPVNEACDESLLASVKSEEEACQKWLDVPLGRTACDLTVKDEFAARLDKAQLITFLNLVQTERTHAQISASALFSGATGFGEVITMRHIVSTYVFANTLTVKKVSGKILREYLEKDVLYWDVRDGKLIVNPAYDEPAPMHFNYDMLDGVEYTVKVSNTPGSRIISLLYEGEEVKDSDEFTLCISNYRAAGGGDFGMLKECETVLEDTADMVDILAEYIMAHPVITVKEAHNIHIIP